MVLRVLVLFFMLTAFSSKSNYDFDYRIEYERESFKSNSVRNVNYYVNSKTNDYYLSIWKNSDNKFELYFRDQDTLTAQGITNVDYINPSTIILPNEYIKQFKSNSWDSKNYKLEKLEDTLINNKKYNRVIFKTTKTRKKNKYGYHIYVIDTTLHTKPLLTDPFILNVWRRLNIHIPDGLIIEKQVFNKNGELVFTEKMKSINRVNFELIVQ